MSPGSRNINEWILERRLSFLLELFEIVVDNTIFNEIACHLVRDAMKKFCISFLRVGQRAQYCKSTDVKHTQSCFLWLDISSCSSCSSCLVVDDNI